MPKVRMVNWQVVVQSDTGWKRRVTVSAPDFGTATRIVHGWLVQGVLMTPEPGTKEFFIIPPHKIHSVTINPQPLAVVEEVGDGEGTAGGGPDEGAG